MIRSWIKALLPASIVAASVALLPLSQSQAQTSLRDKVAAAVTSYGGSGAIEGWAKGAREPYAALQGRLAPVRKGGVFAQVEGVKIDSKEVMADMPSLKDPQYVAVRHHFVRPGGGRMGD